MPHDPCNSPLMKPRERIGQLSIAKAAPAGHSAPMPKPRSARNTKRNQKVGEKPAMKLQSEYHRIEIISGMRRPTRSPSQPEQTAPTRRIHKVTVNTTATSVSGTPNSCEIGSMISRKIVKSKESRVQPSHAATQASHWSLVGSFHQAMGGVAATAVVMAHLSSLRCQQVNDPLAIAPAKVPPPLSLSSFPAHASAARNWPGVTPISRRKMEVR